MEKLTLKGTRFVNESGKEVILHGLNVLQRQRENNHFYPGFEKAFGYFRRSGFNLLRFGIFWDGAEPEPGQVDMEYLRKVKDIVNLAEENGIYILLDMHQDLGLPRSSSMARLTGHAWTRACPTRSTVSSGTRPTCKATLSSGRRTISGQTNRLRTAWACWTTMPLCGGKSRRPWMAAEISSALSP